VQVSGRLKKIHQTMDSVSLCKPVTKYSAEVDSPESVSEVMELETAVRLKSNLVHMILIDGSYDMVAEQEILKYGRPSGTDFGPVDPVKYAEAFGAKGLMVRSPDQIPSVLMVPAPGQGSTCPSSRLQPR
jgi:acetolactate synthase I/II/III large subunit